MFSKSTWIRLPRNVVIGHDVLPRVREAVEDARITGSPLIVTSPTPKSVAGDRVAAQFDGAQTSIVETASFDAIDRIIDDAEDAEADFIIGVGGGKAIDLAKMAADARGVGLVSVPTAASHDGIVSGRGSVPEGDSRHSVAAEPPLAVIADTGIIADAPWELTTAGCADIISNYTAVRDWELAHRLQGVEYSEYAGSLARMTAEMLVSNADSLKPGLEASAWVVVKALVSSGVAMSIAGSSRPASGAEHLISHRLDSLGSEPALHGHQVGVASIATAYLHGDSNLHWDAIRDALVQIGAPTTADGLSISDEMFIEAMTTAHTVRDRHTILGGGINEAAAREAATLTGIIE